MTNKILEGMTDAFCAAGEGCEIENYDAVNRYAIRAAMLWLAENVSDEMVKHAHHAFTHNYNKDDPKEDWRLAISAALKAAAEE